jgi:hypothetical protein
MRVSLFPVRLRVASWIDWFAVNECLSAEREEALLSALHCRFEEIVFHFVVKW